MDTLTAVKPSPPFTTVAVRISSSAYLTGALAHERHGEGVSNLRACYAMPSNVPAI
jgi:hypothetical protein